MNGARLVRARRRRTPTTSSSRSARGGPDWHLALGRLRDLPRPLRVHAALDVDAARLGGAARLGRAADRPRPRRRRSSSSAATCAAIEQHLDHIESLGANVDLPDAVLPGRQHPPLRRDDASTTSTRCSAATRRSPRSSRAAHARGIRVLGDLTLEPHAAHGHEWFQRGARRPVGARARVLLLRRRAAERLRVVARRPARCRSSTGGSRGAARADRRRSSRRWLEPPSSSTAGGSTSRTWPAATASVDLNRDVARWIARRRSGDALLVAEHGHDFRPDLGGDGWHGVMNYAGFLRPVWTWLRGDDPEPEQRRQFWGIPVGVPQLDGAAAVAAMRALPRRRPVGVGAPLVDAARQPRHRALPHRRRLARAPARRRRPADDDCPACRWSSPATSSGSRASGARTRAGRCRGTARRRGTRRSSSEYRALIALRRSSDALARGGIRYVARRRRRDRLPARDAERAAALPRRARRARRRSAPLAGSAQRARDALRRRRDVEAATPSCPPTAPHSTSGDLRMSSHG